MAIIVLRHSPISRGGLSKQVTHGGMSNISLRLGVKLLLRLEINIFPPQCRGKGILIKMISNVNVCILLMSPQGVSKGRV